LNAYEPAAGKVKTFKTRRIDDITLLDTSITYRAGEDILDLFDWSGPHPIPIVLQLTSRAYRLLIEDYPPTRVYVSKQGDDAFPYRLGITVRDFRGIGRFILGLPGEIQVEKPPELKDYLRERIREFRFW
jgi:predicted DNA-binding transcriptional regulator YafY